MHCPYFAQKTNLTEMHVFVSQSPEQFSLYAAKCYPLLSFSLSLVIKISSGLFYHLKFISSNLVLLYVKTKQITKVSFYYRPCFYRE